MVGRLLVGFVWLKLQFSESWQVDFQWGSCGSIFTFLSHGWQNFSGVRVAQSFVFCVMVGRLLVGFVCLNLQFSVSWLVDFQWGSCCSIFSFCVMVGRFIVGFVWLNLLFSVSWLVDFQWGSCGGIVSFLCHGRQIFSGVRVAQSSFLCHGWQTFRGVRVAQSLGFCVMVGRPLAGLVWLNLQFYVSWLQTFSGVRVVQSFVFCVMVGRLLVGFVSLNLQFCVMVGRHLVGFVWLNLQFSVSWLVDFSGLGVAQSLIFCVMVGRLLVGFVWLCRRSCVSIFSFLCHGWQTFSGVRVALSLVFCVMVGRLLVGFVWLNVQISVSCQVDFQWDSCVSIFSFLCHGRQTFSGVRVAQSLLFCVMIGRLLVGFVWLNLQISVLCLVDFQWGSCGSNFSFLCHGRQTFSGVRVAQSFVF